MTCDVCGVAITATPNNASRKRYCSERCRERVRMKTRRRAPLTCPVCLATYQRASFTQETCSYACSVKAQHIGESCPINWHRCHCGSWYIKRDARWHCSHRRTDVGRLANALRRVSCLLCGEAVLTKATTQRYCSVTCAKRAHKDTREARQRGATIERVHRQRVYERDGWVCQLCRRPVKRDAQVPHPLAPTLDHIIPLAAGGAHAYANVQLAHFLCNSTKSDGNAQLRWDIAA